MTTLGSAVAGWQRTYGISCGRLDLRHLTTAAFRYGGKITEGHMMKRLYFLLPDVQVTREVVDELRSAGIEERHMYTVGSSATVLEKLPEATIVEKTDFAHGVAIGIAGGGIVGALAGLVALAFPPAGLVVGGGAILALGVAGSSVGGLLSGLIGLDYPNSHLEKYRDAVESGSLLLLVDVPNERVPEVVKLIAGHHPDARIEAARAHPIESLVERMEG